MYILHQIDTKKSLSTLMDSLPFHKPSKYATSGLSLNKRPQLTIQNKISSSFPVDGTTEVLTATIQRACC